MKRNDFLLISAILVIACLLGVIFYSSQAKGCYILVKVNNEEYGTYNLKKNQVIEINHTNKLEIKDGKAFMVYADCPDQICVHMAPISHTHEMIVCMPNQVLVEVFDN